MPAIITDRFRIHNSEQFQEAFSEGSGNVMYLGIGRPQAFATSTRGDGRTNNEGTDTARQKELQAQMLLLQYQEEIGQLAQLTIFTDMITATELQVQQQHKLQIVVYQT